MSETLDLILRRKIPAFGVCLGLQGIVEYFGGALDVLALPMHGKPSVIANHGGRLLAGLPKRFKPGDRVRFRFQLHDDGMAVLSSVEPAGADQGGKP